MKKLIMTLAVVLTAAATQAAAIRWSSGSANDGFLDSTGASLKGSSLYTMVVTFYDNAMNVVGTSSSAAAAFNGSYGTTYGGGSYGDGGYDFAAGVTYYASAVITANDGLWVRTADAASFTVAADNSNASINFQIGTGFDTATGKWGEWTSVPEPTGAMLLVLGVAALALRRKRA